VGIARVSVAAPTIVKGAAMLEQAIGEFTVQSIALRRARKRT